MHTVLSHTLFKLITQVVIATCLASGFYSYPLEEPPTRAAAKISAGGVGAPREFYSQLTLHLLTLVQTTGSVNISSIE